MGSDCGSNISVPSERISKHHQPSIPGCLREVCNVAHSILLSFPIFLFLSYIVVVYQLETDHQVLDSVTEWKSHVWNACLKAGEGGGGV